MKLQFYRPLVCLRNIRNTVWALGKPVELFFFEFNVLLDLGSGNVIDPRENGTNCFRLGPTSRTAGSNPISSNVFPLELQSTVNTGE